MSHMHKLSLFTAACAIALPLSASAHGSFGGGAAMTRGASVSAPTRIADPSGHMALTSSPGTKQPIAEAPGLSESLARAPQPANGQSVGAAPRTISRAIQTGGANDASPVPRSITHGPQPINTTPLSTPPHLDPPPPQ